MSNIVEFKKPVDRFDKIRRVAQAASSLVTARLARGDKFNMAEYAAVSVDMVALLLTYQVEQNPQEGKILARKVVATMIDLLSELLREIEREY